MDWGIQVSGRNRNKRNGARRRRPNLQKSTAPRTKASGEAEAPKTNGVQRRSRHLFEVSICTLAAIGAVADISGVIETPSLPQVTLGVVALAVSFAIKVYGNRWSVLRSPAITAVGVGIAGTLLITMGIVGLVRGHSEQRRVAMKATCEAAQDYWDSYLSSAAHWAATGLRTDESERADAVTAGSLDRLSSAANQSGDSEFKDLVYDVRTSANLGLAQSGVDTGAAITSMRTSMDRLGAIFSICSESKFSVAVRKLPVEPTIEKACSYFNDFSFPVKLEDSTEEFNRQKGANFTMFLYHGLNVKDTTFVADVETYIKGADKKTKLGDGMALVARDCDTHGYKTRFTILNDGVLGGS